MIPSILEMRNLRHIERRDLTINLTRIPTLAILNREVRTEKSTRSLKRMKARLYMTREVPGAAAGSSLMALEAYLGRAALCPSLKVSSRPSRSKALVEFAVLLVIPGC